MKIEIKIKELPITKDDTHMYSLSLSTYKDELEGRFEKSELRHLIEVIDNAIHH